MDISMTDLCQEIRNWFDRVRYIGRITIGPDGGVFCDGIAIGLADGQYYRVIGSTFADGVHIYPDADNKQESFDGAVWAMAVPPTAIKLATEIAEWRAKYEAPDAASMSPFSSESFGGYSYSKNSNTSGGVGWQSVFAAKLNALRKI